MKYNLQLLFQLLLLSNIAYSEITIFPNEVYIFNNDEYPYDGPRKTIVNDVNNDNFPDVVYLINSGRPGPIGEPPNNLVRVMINDGRGGVSEVLNKDDSFQFLKLLINTDEPTLSPDFQSNHSIYGPPLKIVVLVDWNQNGIDDLLALNLSPYNPGFMIIPGKPDGTYELGLVPLNESPPPSPVRGWEMSINADFNGDGILDTIDQFSNDRIDGIHVAHVKLGTESGDFIISHTFINRWTQMGNSSFPNSFYVYDFDNDGILDILGIQSYAANMYFGNGDGTFKPVLFLNIYFNRFVQFGDFNGDNTPDILDRHSSYDTGMENEIYISLGKENGTFTPKRTFRLLSNKYTDYAIPAMNIVDYNQDGRDDLWFDNGQQGEFRVSGVWINQYQGPSNINYFQTYK